jgi:glycosylphosphatidylinositol transamidase
VVFTSEHDVVSGIETWIEDYHSSSIQMIRGGKIYAAIGLESIGNSDMNRVIVMPEGLNGFLPNLDLINVVTTTSYLHEFVAGLDTFTTWENLREVEGTLLFYHHMSMSLPRSNHAAFTQYVFLSFSIY